jgi:iron complex transport system ATP-binding protein
VNHKINIINADFGYLNGKEKKILLKEINISADTGENIALIGVNGSGKSTFLRTLSRLHHSISGTILYDGKNINDYSNSEFAKKTGFVSSEIIQANYLKVYDLVSLGRFPYQNISNTLTINDKNIIHNALEITESMHLKDCHIDEISDGERQKVMIARALAQDTPVILLDEPTSFLDLANKFTVYSLLGKIALNQQKTIIFSTHDLNIALKYADKIWLIKDKKIYEGAPEDLIINNIFDDLFENKIVYFNHETNEYNIRFEEKYPVTLINLSGSEKIIQLTISALSRKGFYRSERQENIKVRINHDNTWTVKVGNIEYSVNNLYKVLRILINNS